MCECSAGLMAPHAEPLHSWSMSHEKSETQLPSGGSVSDGPDDELHATPKAALTRASMAKRAKRMSRLPASSGCEIDTVVQPTCPARVARQTGGAHPVVSYGSPAGCPWQESSGGPERYGPTLRLRAALCVATKPKHGFKANSVRIVAAPFRRGRAMDAGHRGGTARARA